MRNIGLIVLFMGITCELWSQDALLNSCDYQCVEICVRENIKESIITRENCPIANFKDSYLSSVCYLLAAAYPETKACEVIPTMGCYLPIGANTEMCCAIIDLATTLDRAGEYGKAIRYIFKHDVAVKEERLAIMNTIYKTLCEGTEISSDQRAILTIVYGRLLKEADHETEAIITLRLVNSISNCRTQYYSAASYWAERCKGSKEL